ncbi:uncharacterized protein L199_008408 [Kwoniella botswanensis]|uniref:uncharacterized protein n=1 Tax=Kwoniella botswanensis TaxID=1268659 RepID=UPI00315C7054
MTTIPFTPSASPTQHQPGSSPSTSNLNKELPSTPRKAHTARSQTPSPSKNKKHSPIFVRMPTPTSPTPEAGKKPMRKTVQAGQGDKEKEEEDGKSLLNPHSSTFEPKSNAENFMSKMRNLSLTDQESSTRYVENVIEKESPSTPKKKKEVPHFDTPRRSIRAGTTTSTPSLSYTPFAPSTGQSSKLPVTPSTPATPIRKEGEYISKEKNTEEQFVSGPIEANSDDIGRYLLIQQIPRDTTEDEIKSLVQSGYDTPAHLLALSRRLHEPGTVEGLINNADIEARARQGQGIGGHWNANDRKAIPAHNRVFPERILSGLDPRTTVMVKDVPNKLSRQELVNILEEVVPGDYDFVYLRFDFKNCCNALYRFIEAKVGKKWNMFSSEKVLQVSYADIQGKAALINKFKNSAVMGVIEAWRPQIFYSSGRMKGKPEPFPDSDNLAVRSRSAAAQLAGFSTGSNYSYGYDDQYYDYSSPHGSTYGI